jgi:hypothetical protein
VVQERPDFLPGWLGLGEVCLRQGGGDSLEDVARTLEGLPEGPLEAALLRARDRLARQEFAAARTLLGEAIATCPQVVAPRLLLSRSYLQEGRDYVAAEEALRAVLALDPQNGEARHNLGRLLEQRAKQSPADAVFLGNVALAQLYHEACSRPSDINEHLPTLYALARECQHVTEMGTRTGVSTTAFLYAQPKKLVCYDRVKYPQVERLRQLAGATEFVFHERDVLWADIEETDLLFIDTWHVYGQLKEELRLHAGKVRKYIALHDTTTFGERGEAEGHQGLWPAVEEFLAKGSFRLQQRFANNNGLTVLESAGKGASLRRSGATA